MAKHEFGIIDSFEENKWYSNYEPEKYNCISVSDDLIEELNSDGKPERITVSLIGSRLGIRGLLEKHIDKLPKTKEYLNSVKETNHDFRLRRIRWAVKELEKEGEELQLWKIMRKASVREEYVTELENILR